MQWWRLGDVKADHIEERLQESDGTLREVANIILELKASADKLETVLSKLKEEDG